MPTLNTALDTVRFLNSVLQHPLNLHQKPQAILRWLQWQVGSRIVPGSVVIDFVNQSKLVIQPSMRGATENIYTGLYDFEDMSFVLHLLQPDDWFVDVGANVGTYTVLASAGRKAHSIAIEPNPKAYSHLVQNICINNIQSNVESHNIGLGRSNGTLSFTSHLDCGNHVVLNTTINRDTALMKVPIKTLGQVLNGRSSTLIKIDVEGFETDVIIGGKDTFSQEGLLAVILEINGSGLRYGYDDQTVHQLMLSYGFLPFNYSPFDRKLLPLESVNRRSRNTLYLRNIAQIKERLKNAPCFTVHGVEV